MSPKINPVVAVVIAAVALIAIIFVGFKMMGGSDNGGSEGTAVIVKPSNPNDPKFTEHLPKGIAGGGMNAGGQ